MDTMQTDLNLDRAWHLIGSGDYDDAFNAIAAYRNSGKRTANNDKLATQLMAQLHDDDGNYLGSEE